MFEKQIKVRGEYVVGMITGKVLQTNQLVAGKPGALYNANQLSAIINELTMVKKELEGK